MSSKILRSRLQHKQSLKASKMISPFSRPYSSRLKSSWRSKKISTMHFCKRIRMVNSTWTSYRMVRWSIEYRHWAPLFREVLSSRSAISLPWSTWARKRIGSKWRPRSIRREIYSLTSFCQMIRSLQASPRIPHWISRPKINKWFWMHTMNTG